MTPSTIDIVRDALRAQVKVHQQALDRLAGKTRATTNARKTHRDAIADLRAALAELEEEGRRSTAVFRLINVLVDRDNLGPQSSFTSVEADAFAELLRAFGRSTAAAVFLEVQANTAPGVRA